MKARVTVRARARVTVRARARVSVRRRGHQIGQRGAIGSNALLLCLNDGVARHGDGDAMRTRLHEV